MEKNIANQSKYVPLLSVHFFYIIGSLNNRIAEKLGENQ